MYRRVGERAGQRVAGARGDRRAHALCQGERYGGADCRARHKGRRHRRAAGARAHCGTRVLYFEGDRHAGLRLLRAVKNRFGSANEIGVFEMGEQGMRQVLDPSRLFLSGENATGCAVTCAIEGSRPMLAEVQSLLIETSFGSPRRTAAGIDGGRLSLLLAVLEKRARLKLSDKDVYVNVVGNLRLEERGADLAVALCIALRAGGQGAAAAHGGHRASWG